MEQNGTVKNIVDGRERKYGWKTPLGYSGDPMGGIAVAIVLFEGGQRALLHENVCFYLLTYWE